MKIVKYINILNAPYTFNGTNPPERFYLDTSKFSGTCAAYLEVLITTQSGGSTHFVYLYLSDTTQISNSQVATGTPADLKRSSDCWSQLSTGFYTLKSPTTSNAIIKSARLVIIQDTGSNNLIATESQFEIGASETSKTNTTIAGLTSPKYYKHVAANYDGTVTGYAEVVYQGTGTMYLQTFRLQKSTDFATWTDVVTIVNAATTSTTITRTRSASFTLEDGVYYRLAGFISNNMESYSVFCAKVIIQQVRPNSASISQSIYNGASAFGNGGVDAFGQSITPNSSFTLTSFEVYLYKNGSPTDNLYAEIRTGSMTGTLLATSSNIAGSQLTTSASPGQLVQFLFSSGVSLTNGTAYYIVIKRSGSQDGSNYYGYTYNSSDVYAGGSRYTLVGGTWSASGTTDIRFEVWQTSEITKTVGELLVANVNFAAGTALQNFLAKYDPAEWDGVTVNHIHQIDSDSPNSSVIELVSNVPENLEDFYGTGNESNATSLGNGTATGIGNSFNAGVGGILSKTEFLLKKFGSPTGNVYCKVYSITGTHGTNAAPNTLLATSDPLDAASLTTTNVLRRFLFSGANQITLTQNTKYFVSVEFTGGSTSDLVSIARDDSSPSHAGNIAQYLSGSWTTFTSVDNIFYVYTGAQLIEGSIIDSLNYSSFSANIFYGSRQADNNIVIASDRPGVGQSFVGDGGKIIRAEFALSKNGTPTGNAVAKIYAHSGTFGTNSIPTGSALATSDNVDVANLGGFRRFIFSFSGANQIQLTNGTNYVLVIEYTGGSIAGNSIAAYVDLTSSTGNGNHSTSDSGGTWTAGSGDLVHYIGTSKYMAMPSSATNLDVRATTNSGLIYASKIISVIEKAAGGAMTGSMTTLSATTGTLAGAGALSSTVAASSTLSATIHGIADITGSLAAAGSMTGDMIAVYAITANIASVSSLGANLAGAGALAATTSATGAMTATLQASGLLASNLSATSNLTGTISGIIQATATMPAVSSLSGTIQSINAITGSMTSASSLTGTLSAGGTLASTVASVAALSGTLAGIGSISVTIASVAMLSGSISGGQGMDSSIPCTSSLTGTLSGKAVATSTIAIQASLSSTISGSGALTGQLVTASSLSGTLTGKGALSSSFVASAVLSGTLSSGTGMQTTIACTSSLSGTLAGRANATSTITSVAVLSGSGTLRANISGNISATSLLSATITGTRNGTAALASFSSMAGSLSGSGALQSDMPAVSSIGASVNANGELVCSMDAVSVMDGTLTFTADGYMTCTIVCTSSLIHRLNYDVELLAKPSTVSTSIFSADAGVLASITQTSYITTALQSESLLTKTLSTKSLISDTYGESNI